MDRDQVADDLCTYLVSEVRALYDPQNRQQIIREFDGKTYRSIEDAADVFTRLLVRGSGHPLLANLSGDILNAFSGWRAAPGNDKQALRECADHMAMRLEPFWKLVLLLTTGEEPRNDGLRVKALLGKVLPHSWQDGNQIDRYIKFAREWRHDTAHNAPNVSELDLRLYMEAALGVYLLVIEENYDKLAPLVLSGAQQLLQDHVWQERYLTKVANPPRLTEFYVPSIGVSGEPDGDATDLSDLIDRFMLDKAARVLLLIGEAGSGKSTFLRRQLADVAQEELDRLARGERILRLPIYFPLEDLPATLQAKLDRILVRNVITVSSSGVTDVRPEEFLDSGHVTYLVGMDGLDELGDWELGTQKVLEFFNDYSETRMPVKVIVSSRPSVLSESWKARYPIIEIKDWTEAEVRLYLQRRMPELSEIFLDWLDAGHLLSVVRLPLLLESVADFWLQSRVEIEDAVTAYEEAVFTRPAVVQDDETEQEEKVVGAIPLASIEQEEREWLLHRLLELLPPVQAIDQAIQGLLEHQLGKMSGPDRFSKIDKLLKSLQRLAFELDGHDSLDANRARDMVENDLDDLLQMSLVTRRRHEVRFCHEAVKLCLAAKELGYRLQREADLNQSIDDFMSRLPGSPAFWQQCYVAATQVLPIAAPFPVSWPLLADPREGRSVSR